MDPNRWLKAHIPGYAALSLQERKAIKEFALLWSLYEGTRLNTRGSASAIATYVAGLHAANRLLMQPSFQSALFHFRGRYYTDHGFNHSFAGLQFRQNDRRLFVESVLSGQIVNDEGILTALLIIIYRLRNNLFHGEKWSYGIANQRENFRHANDVLMATMML